MTGSSFPLRTTRESHVTLLSELCLILYVDESSCNIKRNARVEMECFKHTWWSCEIHVSLWRPFLHVVFSLLFQRASNYAICNTLLIRLFNVVLCRVCVYIFVEVISICIPHVLFAIINYHVQNTKITRVCYSCKVYAPLSVWLWTYKTRFNSNKLLYHVQFTKISRCDFLCL